MYKKLKKLIKSPGKFWFDSKFNQKNRKLYYAPEDSNKKIQSGIEIINKKILIALKENNITLINKDILMKPLLVKLNGTYLIEQLKDYDASVMYIEPLEESMKWAICINKTNKEDFFVKFSHMLYEEGINLRYKFKEKIKIPKSINEFWSDVSLLKIVDIRLNTSRSINNDIYWFRLEYWEEFEDYYMSPTANYISRKLWKLSLIHI